jgi:UDP-N-acetylmuramate dehydrogenase
MPYQENTSLRPYNTFGMDVQARKVIRIASAEDLKSALQTHQPHEIRIIGGGSNILMTKNIDAVCLINQLSGKSIVRRDDEHVWVRFASGENWHEAVQWCVNQGFGGLENLSLIPGTCGAAPIQNIGAYGVELKDVFDSLEAFHLESQQIEIMYADDCHFSYRDSIFKQNAKGKYFILSITLRLSLHPILNTSYGGIQAELDKREILQPGIKDVAEVVIAIRKSKLPDPLIIGNAGSFFKNPVIPESLFQSLQKTHPQIPSFPTQDGVKIPAAWLIEQCGWKGFREGDAGVHPHQALVLVNYDQANGMDIYALSEKIITSVQQAFNISLEREVNIW